MEILYGIIQWNAISKVCQKIQTAEKRGNVSFHQSLIKKIQEDGDEEEGCSRGAQFFNSILNISLSFS